jgi:DNA-binding winged helix-turn-helix (wHTH) protein
LLRSVTYRLGHWTFVPSAHELRSGPARVRLEQRASATLSLLSERTGEVVSREQIVDRAWGRRHLSANSVAVVIGDLRRALDIPLGEPGSIETVPKAGYRLIGGTSETVSNPRRLTLPLLLAALAALILVGVVSTLRSQPAATEIAVGSVQNAMGTSQYDPLIRACSETVLVQLGRYGQELRIVETPVPPGDRPDLVLQQRWVLWSGSPELVLVATDSKGQAVWSGAIYGDENQFPAKISAKVRDLAALARSSRRS